MESTAAVANGGEGGDEYRDNGTGAGYDIQVSLTVGAVICEEELGGDIGHAKITRGVPSSVSEKNCGDDVVAYDERRVGVDPGE